MRDTIDPISLIEIDDCNEWLTGKLNEDDDTVFSDDEELTWNTIARAAGVGEPSYQLRANKSVDIFGSSSRLSLERDEREIEEEEQDGEGFRA